VYLAGEYLQTLLMPFTSIQRSPKRFTVYNAQAIYLKKKQHLPHGEHSSPQRTAS